MARRKKYDNLNDLRDDTRLTYIECECGSIIIADARSTEVKCARCVQIESPWDERTLKRNEKAEKLLERLKREKKT